MAMLLEDAFLPASSDSSAGFVLPNGARRSPDSAWTLKSEIAKLPAQSREGFWHLCPAFVIEPRPATDRLRTARAKMQEYIDLRIIWDPLL